MTRPAVTPATEDVYSRVEEFRRDADAALDYPLLRFVSLAGDQLDALRALTERIDFDRTVPGATSDLVDPATADAAWLPWLAQAAGVNPVGDTQTLRDRIDGAPAARSVGTRAAIVAAARSELVGTGTLYVQVRPASIGYAPGGEYDVTIVTLPDETPDAEAVVLAIDTAHAKPAGVNLYHVDYMASVAMITAAYPLVSNYAGLTVAHIQETGP